MSTIPPDICANCGKGEEASIDLKTCTACKMVKYCSRECQISHRPQHKKECKRRAKELHDEKLFQLPPPLEDCPICMMRLPSLELGRVYMACCGKVICNGCVHTFRSRVTKKKDDVCPFCRTPLPTSVEEKMKRYKERSELNDEIAIYCLGVHYKKGENGLPQNTSKALELYHQAGELGSANGYYAMGNAYMFGEGGREVDEKKAIHYWELAAMRGNVDARYNLGIMEKNAGNMKRASRHFMTAVRDGDMISLENIKCLYSNSQATKDDYAKALRAYQAYLDEIKSDQRDEAAAYRDKRYY